MGLPVSQLVIATNRNDVLHRVLSSGLYDRQPLEPSLSPSMDITVSSNFERLLFDLYGRDGATVAGLMRAFDDGEIRLSPESLAEARSLFSSYRVDDRGTCAEIAGTWAASGYLLDPHSAIGLAAARAASRDPAVPMVTLATAHPAKFPDAVRRAGLDREPALPAHLADLYEREERYTVLPNDLAAVQAFMADNLSA